MIDDIRALAADIDMTLTAKGGDLPAPTIEAFRILHDHGVMLGLATGREITDREKNQGRSWNMGFEFDFIVGMNGGMVYDAHDNSMWTTKLLSTKEMKDILTYMMPLVDKYRIAVNAEGGGNHNAMYLQGEMLDAMKRHGWSFIDVTGDIDAFCAIPTFKFLFRSESRYDSLIRETFLKKFGDDYQIFGTYPGTLEVMHKGIDKGSGMKRYCRKVNIPMADVIAFGDSENDNTLLKEAGWGVCLKNGTDETKTYADAITEYDCNAGGVGLYLRDHYLKPKGWM